ncbi:trypsin-like peptidase domain-containing protein [Aliikangiella maris]|uniref:Trypsin-like peptidase domain-containing protein n=2 Tax=Aliikangiella maris TaxID=3162458 RepID=A0ABV2BYX7_9GAMM
MYNRLILLLFFYITLPAAIASESSQWNKTIANISDSVVSIRVNVVRTFDTESSKTTQATGFVVDAKRGIILTNRHVVNPGPITAEAIFANNEEIDLTPIYRDPVHDFGFFQYNPQDLQFIQPKSLKLAKDGAKIGVDIKVIGNDSGEHMSILSGTLARLDRPAPQYRRGGYNDFNTFYFQSSADTSGGSSGSPVIDIQGQVIALNAGGNHHSSSSFFLPLYKVTQALKAIQNAQPVSRGTIFTTLTYQPYDEARRLGLSQKHEALFRKKNPVNGVLVIERLLAQSPAAQNLKIGDIILSARVNNQTIEYTGRFDAFELFLDQHVAQNITLTVSRFGQEINVEIPIADLHKATPRQYVQVAGGIFNNFSYQLARQTNLPIEGVYIASPGYMFSKAGINRGNVIQAINQQPIKHLDDFIQALSTLKQNEYFSIKYVSIGLPNQQQLANIEFQTRWHLSQSCQQNLLQHRWTCQQLNWHTQSQSSEPTQVKLTQYNNQYTAKIANSLVMVQSTLPYHIDGQNFQSYSGTGLILDAKQGLVLADRNTVPIKMLDVSLTISGVTEIPANVLFVHPIHSFVLLQYDPSLLPNTPLKSARLSEEKLSEGDTVWLVGYQTASRIIGEPVLVSSVEALKLPMPDVPQFRDANSDAIVIDQPPAVASGVLIDSKGIVRSWWTNFTLDSSGNQTIDRGLPVDEIIRIRNQWQKQQSIVVNSLEIEALPISIAQAKNYGLSNDWMKAIQNAAHKPQVLKVYTRTVGTDAFNKIQNGDLLLAIDQQIIRNYQDLHQRSQATEVMVTVWRDKKAINIPLKTHQLNQLDTNEIYLWGGAILQKPHRALAVQMGIEAQGVYVSWYWYGSPANRYHLTPLHRIIGLEDYKIESLEQFIRLTKEFRNKKYLRLRLMDLSKRESVITLKPDHQYWPTQKIFWDEKNSQWRNQLLD